MKHASFALLLVTLTACLAETVEPVELTVQTKALTPEQQLDQEVQRAFDDAACLCESYLIDTAANAGTGHFSPGRVDPPADECVGDPRLARFANRFRSGSNRIACTISSNFPHGTVKPRRWTEPGFSAAEEHINNGCMSPVALHTTDFVNDSANGPSPTAGFCRADFNYCLAQQLRIQGESFARAPSNRNVRDALIEEARNRFSLSANEHLMMLEWADDKATTSCQSPQICTSHQVHKPAPFQTFQADAPRVCEQICEDTRRLAGGTQSFAARAPCRSVCFYDFSDIHAECNTDRNERLQMRKDAVPDSLGLDHLIKVSHRVDIQGKRGKCMLTEEYVTYTQTPCGCNSNRHEREQSRIAQGYREVALSRVDDAVHQVSDLARIEVRSQMARADALNPVKSGASYGADVWGPTGSRTRAAQVLAGTQTLAGNDLAYATVSMRDGLPLRALQLILQYRLALPIEVCGNDAGYWLTLDNNTLTTWAAKVHTSLANAVAEQLDSDGEPFAVLREEHGLERHHIRSAIQLLHDRTLALDVDYAFEAVEESETEDCSYAALSIQGVFENQRDPRHVASLLSHAGAGSPNFDETLSTSPECSSQDWYSGHREQLRKIGAIGSLQTVRHRLMRIMGGLNHTAYTNHETALATRASIDELIGAKWSSYTPVFTWGAWISHHGLEGGLPGDVLLVENERELYCLQHGHYPGVAERGCNPDKAPVQQLAPLTIYGMRAHYLAIDPSTVTETEKRYVVLRQCQGTACQYELLDVVRPTAPGVHAFGGSLGELFAKALAKMPSDPARPRFNSLELPTDLVPPLENALTDDGDLVEDSFERYLDAATNAQIEATQLLINARALELEYLSHQRSVDLQQDSAEQAQQEVISTACGATSTDMTCALEREEVVTLGELGLIQDPALLNAPGRDEPAGYGEHEVCTEFLANMRFQLPSSGRKEYVKGFMGAALRCTRWLTQYLAYHTEFSRVPTRVVEEFTSQGSGEFLDQGGEARELLIEQFAKFREISFKMRQFDTLYQVASIQLDRAAEEIEENTPSAWEKWTCRIGKGLKILGTLAAAGVAIYAFGPGGLAVASVAGLAGTAGAITLLGKVAVDLGGAVESSGTFGSCSDDSDAVQAALGAWASSLDAMEQMRVLFDEALRTVSASATIGAQLDSLEARVALAAERAELEARLASAAIQGDPAWRVLQGHELTRARQALFHAMQRAFIARRAIEVRLGTDLRWNADPVTLGIPTALWIDDLYTVDTATASSGNVTVNVAHTAIGTYIQRLSSFVGDYGFDNPLARGTDREYIDLTRILRTDQQNLDLYEALLYKCHNYPALLLGGGLPEQPVAEPCEGLGGVDYAQTSFYLPSHLSGYLDELLSSGNTNYRLLDIGINLAGGIKVCSLSDSACNSANSLRFSMSHDGTIMVENLDHEHRLFAFETGLIQEAKGLMVDEILPSPAADAAMETFMRSEWRGRPLSGRYTLRIHSRPYISWEDLEEVQIVVGYEYWTPQGPLPGSNVL